MTPANPDDVPVRNIRDALRALHQTLLQAERVVYERSFGRIESDFYLLQLAAEDPQFAWLRALSAEMMHADAAVRTQEPFSGDVVRLLGMRIRALLLGGGRETPFSSRYQEAMRSDPAVIMAHSAVMRSLPPPLPWPVYRHDGEIEEAQQGEAHVRFHRPGEAVPGHDDHGYGPLAMIAETLLPPGAEIPPHEHRNEEIVSWVPAGMMRYQDPEEGSLEVGPGHMLVLSAGRGLSHAIGAPEGDAPLRLLEIFVRPDAVNLEPAVQHGEVPPVDQGAWRLLVGPEGGDAPLVVHNRIEIHDLWLAEGERALLPVRQGWHRVLFVFEGAVDIAGITFGEASIAVIPSDDRIPITAPANATLVAVLVDPAAKVTRAGTFAR